LGVGIGLGIPPGLVAGMIISGAFFGDKMSPISDTTNLAALTAKTTIYSHIGSMLFTTIPAYIVTLVLFTLVGLGYSGAENVDAAEVALIQEVLATEFDLNPMVLAPMVALLTMMIVRVHTLPAMLTGVVVATIVSLVFQDASLASALTAINEGYTNKTGIEVVDTLIVRGGIQSMMYTFSLTFIALSLGGVLDQVGYLRVVVEKTIEKIKSAASLITFVLFSTAFSNAATGDTYISIILNGSLYGDTFDRTGLDRSTLSRLLEEGGTMTGALIPWTSTGAFITGTLGVSTLSYLPYCFLNIINPMLSIALAYVGLITFRDVSRIVAAKRADAL
jgi:NhaC family Na+:H+ antiporter